MEASSHNHDEYLLEVRGLSMRYGQRLIQENLNFHIFPGEVFIIMGGSGCGKSTLLYHLIGLLRPYTGEILLDGQNLWEQDSEQRARLMRQLGFLYQKAGLWSSMTLAENIALPLREYSNYS
ncbi:MAG: ATP-binding cassette domain-containing protein, partial [Lentisphaeria bacterium]|nr:ATP-binding cassette domain-containing protein [Lentisphaeria bacterium]